MQWSDYSIALFDMFTHSESNITVQACPGSGKTTNIKHIWGLDNKPTVYLVFNKHNQIEAQEKLPAKAASQVLTLNGLGHRILLNNYGSVVLDGHKVESIVRQYKPVSEKWPYGRKKAVREQRWSLQQAVQKAKMYSVGESFDYACYEEMLSTYDLDEYPGMYTEVQQCLALSDDDTHTIDYDDQIRLPAVYDLNMPTFTNVLGDEVQDFSPIQAQLVRKLHAERYVFVGDCHQSMYGFRGAMNNSMTVLKDMFDCVQLPLSITYRCPSDIVEEAARLYSDIEPYCNIHRGVVWTAQSALQAGFNVDTLVLCRINRPLIELAYKLLDRGTACYVRGRDIGTGLISLIKKQDADNVGDLINKLEFWSEMELAKAKIRSDQAKVRRISDRYDSLMLFCSKCKLTDNVSVVIGHINGLFEQGRGICLSTVHKAKGLEARRVVIVESGLCNYFASKAVHAWRAEQEKNIQYVAVTRSQQELIYA